MTRASSMRAEDAATETPAREAGRVSSSPTTSSRRAAWLFLIAALLVYLLGFAALYPRMLTINDESYYIRQAVAFSEGTRDLQRPGTETPLEHGRHMSEYPIGTSILAVPFVAAFGWTGAFLVAPLCLIAAVLLTGRWIEEEGRSPAFAVCVLAFVPALALARTAMSDVPSTAFAALGLWLFFRGERASPSGRATSWWLLAGFVASLSAFLREPNVIVFAPFFAGSVLRRRRGWWALVLGGVAGLALRPLALWLMYDDPFFAKDAQPFSLAAVLRNLPLYVGGLTLLVPGGLVAVALYRGPRRAELVTTVVAYLTFFLVYSYNASESGAVRQLVLSMRFFLPLVPLLAFAIAEVATRLATRWLARASAERAATARKLVRAAMIVGSACLAVALLGAHVASARWAASRAAIRDVVYARTTDGAVLLTNSIATGKYINELYGPRRLREFSHVDPSRVPGVLRDHPDTFLVFFDRDESSFWAANRRVWVEWRDRVRAVCTLRTLHSAPTGMPGEHLTIERVTACSDAR